MVTDFLLAAWHIVTELAPWLFFGAAVAGLLHVIIPEAMVIKHLGGSGLGAMARASLAGVPLPLCSCSVIPTGLGLRRQGASPGACISFITSTPQTGVDSIAVTVAFLGWPFTLFKWASAFVIGVLTGWASEWVGGAPGNREGAAAPSESTPPADGTAGGACCGGAPAGSACESNEGAASACPDTASPGTAGNCCHPGEAGSAGARGAAGAAGAARRGLVFADQLLHMIWRWLVIGVLLSAAMTALLPGAWWPSGPGSNLAAMALCLVIALPLYVCAVASVPIAAALVAAGMPLGAALVFLMAGPATNVATIGAVGRVLGWRIAATYVITVAASSMLLGFLFEHLVTFAPVTSIEPHTHAGPAGTAFGALFLLLLAAYAFRDLRARFKRRPETAAP